MTDGLEVVTTGLRFPEGPVAMPGGSVLVVEIEAGRLTRVERDGAGPLLHQHLLRGAGFLRTAFLTLSGVGQLVSTRWPRPGLPLHFLNPTVP